MAIHGNDIKRIRTRIREFEDGKISTAQLQREIVHTARQIVATEESELRRTIERIGARVAVLAERSLSEPVHAEVLQVVDDLESNLVQWGY